MKTNTFIFEFPLTDFSKTPATHFGNLTVNGNATIGRNEKVIDTVVTGVSYFEPGRSISTNIFSLLKVIRPDLVKELEAAALAHAKDKYELETVSK